MADEATRPCSNCGRAIPYPSGYYRNGGGTYRTACRDCTKTRVRQYRRRVAAMVAVARTLGSTVNAMQTEGVKTR